MRIWNEWATEEGSLGPVYGAGGVIGKHQMGVKLTKLKAIDDLKTRPNSRRILVSAWNAADLPDESVSPQENVHQGKMALAPCICSFGFMSPTVAFCMLTQRSVDCFLGLASNIPSYALLTHMVTAMWP